MADKKTSIITSPGDGLQSPLPTKVEKTFLNLSIFQATHRYPTAHWVTWAETASRETHVCGPHAGGGYILSLLRLYVAGNQPTRKHITEEDEIMWCSHPSQHTLWQHSQDRGNLIVPISHSYKMQHTKYIQS